MELLRVSGGYRLMVNTADVHDSMCAGLFFSASGFSTDRRSLYWPSGAVFTAVPDEPAMYVPSHDRPKKAPGVLFLAQYSKSVARPSTTSLVPAIFTTSS